MGEQKRTDLPRPRDPQERRRMVLAAEWGLCHSRCRGQTEQEAAESAVPPVSGRGMPELGRGYQWITVGDNGNVLSWNSTREAAEATARKRGVRACRIAVVEVVEEPEDRFVGDGGVAFRVGDDGRVVISDPAGLGFVVSAKDVSRLVRLLEARDG